MASPTAVETFEKRERCKAPGRHGKPGAADHGLPV
jgi:hypothetical protein